MNPFSQTNLPPHSESIQMRGGTSGIHIRHFSDLWANKTKNKSLFNKYKESSKDTIIEVNVGGPSTAAVAASIINNN